MSETTTRVKPAYELTVRDFWIRVGEKRWFLPVVKSIGVNAGDQVSEIYASGAVYDVTSTVSGGTFDLSAVALPEDLTNAAMGAIVAGTGLAYDVSQPILPDVECGYYCDLSDGTQRYYYHPRVKMTHGSSRNHQTRTNSPVDPSESYTVRLMTTDEGIWRVRLNTKEAPGVEFLAFCEAQLNTKAKIETFNETIAEAAAAAAASAE